MRQMIANGLRYLLKQTEGSFRPGPYWLPITGGWLPDGADINWWQEGYNPYYTSTMQSAMVEACISAYAQTIAMCPGAHWRTNSKGGRDRIKNSALARIMHYPNDYQTISDLVMNLTRHLYTYGNCYALALRNDRYEISELHIMNPETSRPQLSETGEIFYWLFGNDIIYKRFGPEYLVVPMRDVLHIRLNLKRRYPIPLFGESPVVAAYGDIAASQSIVSHNQAFYMNQARPSAVLSTDLVLDKDQVQHLRDRWNEQVKGWQQGGTPILTAGLKVQPWAQGGKDAEMADMLKLTNEHIALAFRVPMQILGIGGTPYSSTELLMQSWIASGLGFALNHIEEAFGLLFGLKGQPEEYLEFDTSALLRSAFKERIEALSRGVISGVYAPNEARNIERLDSVPFGDEPRVQQQVVPLSAAGKMPVAPAAPPAPPVEPAPEKAIHYDIHREVRNLTALAARVRSERIRS